MDQETKCDVKPPFRSLISLYMSVLKWCGIGNFLYIPYIANITSCPFDNRNCIASKRWPMAVHVMYRCFKLMPQPHLNVVEFALCLR